MRTRAKVLLLSCGLLICGSASAQSNTFKLDTLVNFAGANGAMPVSNLIQASDGNFYGTTLHGGTNGCGTVFQLTPAGKLTTIHNFAGPDGRYPYGSLVEGADGYLYGTTAEGGSMEDGSVYRLSPAGDLVTLHSFSGPEGSLPYSNLILATDGNFYGTTAGGGNYGLGFGTIFRMTPGGVVTTLYNFTETTDGEFPYNNLLQASNGMLYGVASRGENNTGSFFFQTAMDGGFAGVDLTGLLGTVYASSTNLIESQAQELYGVIGNGGTTGNGEIFSVSSTAQVDDVFGLPSNGDGGIPYAGLLLATDGDFYGSEFGYGSDGGTFSFSAENGYHQLNSFSASSGQSPTSSLIQGSDGNLYGNTSAGGSGGNGTLFRLTASDALPAPVQLSFNVPTVAAGTPVMLSWQVINAFSQTLQQCYAFVSGGAAGAGNWTGLQRGELGGEYYSGTAGIVPIEPGQYAYALTCGGVESGMASLNVTGTARSETTTTLTTTPTVLAQGQTTTLTATLGYTLDKDHTLPTGKMTFHYGQVTIGSADISTAGKATLTADSTGLAPGNYIISASYSGDTNYAPSNSTGVAVNLLAQTTVGLSVSPASISSGTVATLLAIVAETKGHQLPTGVVTFYYKEDVLGRSNLLDGQATWVQSTQGLPAGSYPVTAVYSGNTQDAASTSSPLMVTITP